MIKENLSLLIIEQREEMHFEEHKNNFYTNKWKLTFRKRQETTSHSVIEKQGRKTLEVFFLK